MQLILGTIAGALVLLLFIQTALDVIVVYRDKINGAIKVMTLDNYRHQACLLLLFLFLWMDVSHKFIFLLLVFDAVLTLIRRKRMTVLVEEYIGMRGGKRKTDPPALTDTSVSGDW